MTTAIALIAVSLIAAGLCVAVGIMQWRINQLNEEKDRERAYHKVTKKQLHECIDEINHAYKDLSTAIAERDQAKVDAQRADRLRDECEKTMRAAMEENDRMMNERASLYFRNSKGQIAKLHP